MSSPTVGSQRLVDIGRGRRASVEVIGSGEPMLFFMGGPGLPARLSRADAELFADTFATYLIDPHGSGGSTPPADPSGYDHLGHARFYEEVREALGLGPVTVAGASFGGTVALTYASLFPDATTRCIAVSAFGIGADVDQGEAAAEMERMLAQHAAAPWYPAARSVWDGWTDRVLAADDAATVDEMFRTVLPLYCAHPDRPDVRAGLEWMKGELHTDLAADKAWEGGLYQTIDVRPLLARIARPTLVVAGELDLIGGPAQARQIAAAVPGAELAVIPDCGHMVSLEAPQQFRSIVLRWLRAVSAAE